MNGTSGFQEVRSSPADHLRIGSCPNNNISSEQVSDTFFGSILLAVCAWVLLSIPSIAIAQTEPITPSGLNTQINLSATPPAGTVQYDITGGSRPGDGANLFHSFGEFGVPTNNIANFLNETALPTSNILGRVTGGNISNIFGTIQTTGFGNANLFLMNPAGFLFGPNATVNVGGMVAFTSADYLKLTDNARFNTIPNAAADALLTAFPVAAFGFLGSTPGAITVQGSQFTVTEGTGISLVGGNITIQSGTLEDATIQPALLSAPAGRINLASAASPGEFRAGTLDQPPNINGQSFGTLGTIQISHQSLIDVSGNGGGTVLIRGGRFVLDNSTITANVTGPGPITKGVESIGGGIDIQVSQDAVIQNLAVIETNVVGNATPDVQYGSVHVEAEHIEIAGVLDFELFPFTGIRSDVHTGSTGGQSGNIELEANSILGKDLGQIETLTEGAGDAGNIKMTAIHDIDLNTVLIQSSSVNAAGNAGNIDLMSTSGNISMMTLTTVTSQASISNGHAGAITVSAPLGDILLADQVTVFNQSFNAGPIGGIEITAKNLELNGGSFISGDNLTGLSPGNISVTLSDSLSLDGDSGITTVARGPAAAADLTIRAHDVSVAENSILTTETLVSGAGGRLNIDTENLQLTSGGKLRSGSVIGMDEFGPTIPSGAGGTITIQGLQSPAESVLIDGPGSGIFTDTQGTGAGGNIFVNANSVTLQNGGTLSATTSGTETTATGGNITVQGSDIQLKTGVIVTAETFGSGAGGKVTISADQRITVADSFILTGAIPELGDSGTGGDIVLNAPTLTLERSGLFASTSSTGKAGNVALQGQQITLVSDTVVATSTDGQGAAGTIKVEGLQGPGSRATSVALSNSRIESETVGNLGSEGHAGSVVMETARLTLTDSQLSTRSSFSQGSAGQLVVNASDQIQLVRSNITSSSEGGVTDAVTGDPLQTGDAGEIVMRAPHLSIEDASTVTTSTEFNGQGGDITISAGQSVTLNNGSSISASSSGAGNAGNILINAGQNYTSTNSAVTTQAAQASGGNITVLATDMVQLTNSQLNASVQGSSTTVGGNITIDPQYVILQNSQILAQATQGQGGVIALIITNGGLFLPDATSTVSASSQFGVNGTVTIQSPNAPGSGQVQPLGKTPLQATSLLNQHCASLAGGEFSSFTVAGRDSLPTEPSSWLTSPLATLNVGMGRGGKAEGVKAEGERPDIPILSLRQIAPPGFLTQAFALDWSAGCQS